MTYVSTDAQQRYARCCWQTRAPTAFSGSAGFDLDQYIWASVTLYLDIINLFLKILQLLNGRRD